MATTRQGIGRKGIALFRKEIENELTEIKNEFILSLINTFVSTAPIPNIAKYATGHFINSTQITIGSTTQELNVIKDHALQNQPTHNAKMYLDYLVDLTNRRKFVVDQKRFHVTNPYDNVSLSNYTHYNPFIEDKGWTKTGPYHTFARTRRYARVNLEKICQRYNQKTR